MLKRKMNFKEAVVLFTLEDVENLYSEHVLNMCNALDVAQLENLFEEYSIAYADIYTKIEFFLDHHMIDSSTYEDFDIRLESSYVIATRVYDFMYEHLEKEG